MDIRQANSQDIPALVELWVDFMDYHTTLDPNFVRSEDATANWAKYIASILDDKTHRILVATDGPTLAGYIVAIVQEYPPVRTIRQFGFIQEIAVADQFRRKGIARQLLEAAEAWLRSAGVPIIEVKIDVDNDASQALFRSAGFVSRTETLIKQFASDA